MPHYAGVEYVVIDFAQLKSTLPVQGVTLINIFSNEIPLELNIPFVWGSQAVFR